jgi:hypothetical protein
MMMKSTCRYLTGILVALLAAVVSLGCGEEEKAGPPPIHQFDLQVSVSDTDDNPVAKAPVLLDGKTVGYTDRDGIFKAVMSEREGTQVEVAVGNLDAYHVPEDAVKSTALRLASTLEGDSKPVPVDLATVVTSAREDYLVWLDADCGEFLDKSKCQDLPVMYNGEEIARTDDHGKAHFAVDAVPGDTVTVSLKTPLYEPSADDDDDDTFVMKPANPSYDIDLGPSTEVLQISQTFNDPVAAEKAKKEKAKRKRRYIRRRRSAKKKTTTKKKAEKKEKKSDVIDLW